MYGPHVVREHAGKKATIARHIAVAVEEAADEGVKAGVVSVFVSNPKKRQIVLKPKEADELKQFLKNGREDSAPLRVIAHSTYKAVPWKGDPTAAEFIRDELKICARAGIEGLVVHLPHYLGRDVVVKYLSRFVGEAGVRVYLETPAAKPAKSQYESPEKLAALFKAIAAKVDRNLEHVGLCVDTAHLWASGVDLRDYKSARGWLDRLSAEFARLKVSPPVMFHLNDNIHGLGSGRDQHAQLMKGQIWEGYAGSPARSGLAAVIAFARENNIPSILERKPIEALASDYRVLYTLDPDIRIDVGILGGDDVDDAAVPAGADGNIFGGEVAIDIADPWEVAIDITDFAL